MIHGHRNTHTVTQSPLGNLNVPLLDDAFDPDEEEIFDHTELFSLRVAEHEEEEFTM